MPVPCGGCMPCRIQVKRVWAARLLLESMQHSEQCFVTLTYDEAHQPPGQNLVPADVVLWLKRLRKAVSPARLRYFLVGEYGEKTWRPHYHALLFGMPVNEQSEKLIFETWGHGFVSIGDVNVSTVRYVVGYTLKKRTKKTAPGLEGRAPEFARMSRRPGIGHGFALELASSLARDVAARYVQENGVPSTVRQGSRMVPLGRYLREVVATELGIEKTSARRKEELAMEVFDLLRDAGPGATVQEVVQERQRAASVIARERIFSSKGKL